MKKIFSSIIAFILIFALFGCTSISNSTVIELEHGDKFKAKITAENRTLTSELNEAGDKLTFYENEIETLVVAFLSKNAMNNYLNLMIVELSEKEPMITILDEGYTNDITYALISFDNENGGTTYEIIGWIVGTNTGILMDSFESEDAAMEWFDSLNLELLKTNQTNKKYSFGKIDSISDWKVYD